MKNSTSTISTLPPSPSTTSTSNRPTYSCVRCSDRKVRCDRQNPCNACVKHNVQCVFRAPPPPRRKQKRVKDKDGNLKDKLRRYEALLQDLGVDTNRLGNASEEAEQCRATTCGGSEVPIPMIGTETEDALQLPTPASTATELDRSITTSQLLHGQGRSQLVDNSLWSRVVQEFHDPEEALGDSSEAVESDEDFNFILSVARKPRSRYSHPPTERINQLWQIFIENIDPLTKTVHVPSLRPAVQKATTDIERVPRSFEALMFAIYAAAVMSLKDDECIRRLDEPREPLLSRYISATKRALSRAKFMGTVSIVVLQAFVLHLFTVRNIYGPRTMWALTGVAVRIAEGMGLHRDGAELGVPPFEAEMRRRIWWQLKMHEFRATELCGLAKFRGFNPNSDDNTCKMPANINDTELYPGMESPATSSTRPTDMIFFVLRTELASFAGRRAAKFRLQEQEKEKEKDTGRVTNQWDDLAAARSDQRTKDEFVKEIEDLLETKYLRYLDPSQPLHLLTLLIARSSLNIIRFLTHHPRRWTNQDQIPSSEREYVWKISISLLEQHEIMQSDRRLQGFAWCAVYFLQWHVFIHVLDTLRAKPLIPDAEKAWRIIEATYENNPDMISNTKKPIHVAVGNLCLNAFSAYEVALVREGRSIPHIPHYITMLHQQREAAKARRKTQGVRSEEAEDKAIRVPGYKPSEVIHNQARPSSDSRISLSQSKGDFEACDEPPQTQNPSSEWTNPNQAGTSENDAFWLTGSGLDDGLGYGTSGDVMMNMDTDFLLAQDYGLGLEDVTGQSISWTQWDAWLGEAN